MKSEKDCKFETDGATERSCRYCEHAQPLSNGDDVLCSVHGVVSCTGDCRRFVYDPLKRVPPARITIEKTEYVDLDND